MQTLQQFIDKWNGKKIDFDNANQGQCVDLYRQYVKDVLGFPQSPALGVNGGAADIWTTYLQDYFTATKNTPTGVPSPGDIVIWNKRAGGGYGHVAVFVSGDTNGFKSFDQNYRAINVCEVTDHTYTNVTGWLTPKQRPPTSPEPSQNDWNGVLSHFKVKDAKELTEMVDRELGFLKGAREKVSELEINLIAEKDGHTATKQKHDLFIQQVSQLLGSPGDEQSIIMFASKFNSLTADYEKTKLEYEHQEEKHKAELETKQSELAQLRAELEQLHRQVERLETRVNEAISEKEAIQEALVTSTKFASFWKWLAQLTRK